MQINKRQARPISMDKVEACMTIPLITQGLIKCIEIKNLTGDPMNHQQHHQVVIRNNKNSIRLEMNVMTHWKGEKLGAAC